MSLQHIANFPIRHCFRQHKGLVVISPYVTASGNTKLMSLLQATQRSDYNFSARHCFRQPEIMSLCRQHSVNVTASGNTKLMSLLQATQKSGCNFPIRHCFRQNKGLVVMSQRSCCDFSVRDCFWQHKANFPARHCFSCLLYTSPSPRDRLVSRMPSSA